MDSGARAGVVGEIKNAPQGAQRDTGNLYFDSLLSQ
jgi:hypothetical protein